MSFLSVCCTCSLYWNFPKFDNYRFHAKTLELYMAVCYHGNHRVSHALTHHVDLRQMMHCIQCLCKSPRPRILSHYDKKNQLDLAYLHTQLL